MKTGTLAVMLSVTLALVAGCMAQNSKIDYSGSKLQVMVAAETQQTVKGRSLSENEVQSEVDRLLSLTPTAPMPLKLVLFEVPTSGHSQIISPRTWIELRRTVSTTMKKTLEDTHVFREVDFLPDILLPSEGASDLKTLRIAAARAHADGVLVYSTEAGYEYNPNFFSLFYPTIIGAFVAPGSRASSTALSKAILLDVETGYIYSILETYGDASSGMVPYASVDPEKLEFDARKEAMDALSKSVAEKVKKLSEQ